MPFFNFSTTNDPAMMKQGWVPLCAVFVVAGLALFSVGDIYGTKMSAKNSLRSNESLAATEILSSFSSMSKFPDSYSQCWVFNTGLKQCICIGIVDNCSREYSACSGDENCNYEVQSQEEQCRVFNHKSERDVEECYVKAFENLTTSRGVLLSTCLTTFCY